MKKIPLTVNGAEQLKAELQKLKSVARPAIIEAIAEARSHGDLSENAEYEAAKEKQGFIEGRIAELENKLAHAQIINPKEIHAEGKIVFGATVQLLDLDTDEKAQYQIVGDDEADSKLFKISVNSPLARALIGKEEGDIAEVQAPSGLREYEILKVKTDSNKSRYAEIKADYEKLVSEKKEVEEFQQKKTVMKEKLTKEIQEKKEEIEGKQKENTEKSQLIKSLEKEIKELEVSEKELIKGVKDIEIKKRDQENEYGKLIEKISENEKKMETYNYELEEIPEERAKNNEEYKEIENETELQAVKRKLSVNERSRTEIGSVNLSAIEEYERENKRYTELVNQKRDLLTSRESLLTLIGDIENDIIEKFNIALEEINNNFKYMCETILNGAKGAIRLLDEGNMLETGLELSVKYKNKPEQTLMLLSGGEKSMLAVSFIMAIFMFKPSPFTFFDEIEAALDEENTKKIVKLLNKFITKSQFILITHNKETMKGSHRLYGVTMNKEIGESRIISVDV